MHGGICPRSVRVLDDSGYEYASEMLIAAHINLLHDGIAIESCRLSMPYADKARGSARILVEASNFGTPRNVYIPASTQSPRCLQ